MRNGIQRFSSSAVFYWLKPKPAWIGTLIVASLILVGGYREPVKCHVPPTVLPNSETYLPGSKLVSTISSADRVLVVYNYPQRNPGNVFLVLTNDQAAAVVKAVKVAMETPPLYGPNDSYVGPGAKFDWQLQFYHGSKLLAVVPFVGGDIEYDGGDHFDSTGVLGKVFGTILGRMMDSQSKRP